MCDPAALRGGTEDTVGDEATFGIVTVSDRASAGVYEDLSGPAILNFFKEAVKSRYQVNGRATSSLQHESTMRLNQQMFAAGEPSTESSQMRNLRSSPP